MIEAANIAGARAVESATPKRRVSRYHPLLVTLHWVLAILLVAALIVGYFLLAATPNTDPRKIGILQLHMAGGMLILFLMIVRFIVRVCTLRPADAGTKHPATNRIAPLVHYGFYVVVALTATTGYATGWIAGLPAIVFAHSGEPLPATFMMYPTRVAHGYLAALLAGAICLHVIAAFYHQFVVKDALLRRMFFGRRFQR